MNLLSTVQVAQRFNVDSSTVRRWIEHGHLPATRLGARSWMVNEADLEGFEPPKRGRPKPKKEADGVKHP